MRVGPPLLMKFARSNLLSCSIFRRPVPVAARRSKDLRRSGCLSLRRLLLIRATGGNHDIWKKDRQAQVGSLCIFALNGPSRAYWKLAKRPLQWRATTHFGLRPRQPGSTVLKERERSEA